MSTAHIDDSTGYIVNKSEHAVGWWSLYNEIQDR